MQRRKLLARGVVAALLAALLVIVATAPAFAYAYATAVLADSPSLYWPLDEGSGTTAVDGADGHNGTISSAGWAGAGMVTGSTDSVVGNNSRYVRDATGGLNLGASVTLEIWYASTSGTTTQRLAEMIQHPEAGPCPDGGQGNVNALTLQINGGANKIRSDDLCTGTAEYAIDCSVSSATQFDGNPHMVAVTRTSGTTVLYFDGVSCGSSGGNSATFNALDVGSPCAGAGCFSGAQPIQSTTRIGQFAVYHAALTATQVLNHYNASAGAPPATVYVLPVTVTALQGQAVQFVLSSVDSTYHDTTSASLPFSVYSLSPAVGITCGAFVSYIVNCAVTAVGTYTITFQETHGLQTHATMTVLSNPNAFTISPVNVDTTTGTRIRFDSFATNANGDNISIADGFTVSTVSNQSCNAPGIDSVANDWFVVCTYDLAGDYVFRATDLFGRFATANIHVSTATSTTVCTTDIAGVTCILTQMWNTLQNLLAIPGQIIGSLAGLLFTSRSGKNFIDLQALGNGMVPGVTCRSGQTPTHPDGIRCLPFPVSIPWDFIGVISILNVSPVAPSISAHLVAPPINAAFTIDPTFVLTSQVMIWVRGCELILFVVGLAIGTYRFVQAWGSL